MTNKINHMKEIIYNNYLKVLEEKESLSDMKKNEVKNKIDTAFEKGSLEILAIVYLAKFMEENDE